MKKLNKIERQNVSGGSITGSLLTGISNLILAPFTAINTLIGSITAAVFVSEHKSDDKVSATIGGSKMEFDNTQTKKMMKKQEIAYDLPPLF